jgi:hypothetical protein
MPNNFTEENAGGNYVKSKLFFGIENADKIIIIQIIMCRLCADISKNSFSSALK